MNDRKVPKLRFPEFSGDWSKTTLSNIVIRVESGISVNSEDFPVKNRNEAGVLKTSCIMQGIFKEIENKKIIPQEVERAKISLVKNTILVSRMNTPQLVGESGFIADDYPHLFIPDRLWMLFFNEKLSNTKFISLLMIRDKFRMSLSDIATGTSNSMKNISKTNFLSIPITLSSEPEQSKIADFLTNVDDKIQQLTQKKELLEQYKKGIVQQMFSQQIRFKDDNGNNYPNWQEKELKEIAEVNPKSENLPNNFYYVDLESVNNGRVGTLNYINSNDAPSRAQRVLSQNDILFQMVRPYQRNNLLFSFTSEDNYVASTGYAQLRARENYDYKFIFQMLLTENFVNTVMLRCTGTSYPAVNSSDLSTITINIPKYEEQVKIADFLTSLDDKITQVNNNLEQTKLFKKSLLQQLFI